MESTTLTNTIHPLFEQRRSLRAFAPTPVSPEALQTLFEAARWAPSAVNEQPWRYIYATQEDKASFTAILECLAPSNQVWAQHAPVLMISIAKTFLGPNQNPNKHAWHDVGAANSCIALQAAALGLSVHQMGGFSPEKVLENFRLPAGYEPVCIMAVGYPGDPDQLPENLKQRELASRQRNATDTFAFPLEWKQRP